MHREQGAKDRMLQAATELLECEQRAEDITVRKIAERAGVGVGLISYYFDSKDHLLSVASRQIIKDAIDEFSKQAAITDPIERLKAMIKVIFDLDPGKQQLIQFLLTLGPLRGDLKTSLYLVDVLHEIYGETKGELELRILALQMLQPLEIALMTPEEFRLFSGVDVYDRTSRNEFIDLLVENLIQPR